MNAAKDENLLKVKVLDKNEVWEIEVASYW